MCQRLEDAGFTAGTDDRRGYDHDVFISFKLIDPDADIPVLQLSMMESYNPTRHLAMGRALAPLRNNDTLIISSGISHHNLPHFFIGRGDDMTESFDSWLGEAVINPALREMNLPGWQTAPAGKSAHPEPEHLLPLLVAAGAAEGKTGDCVYHDRIAEKPFSGFRFG
ncbi:DODA-type extradiol aromatic ring-opening family dioxygenase [Sodalis sp. RH22]|uniref:DODA-type extradiol aromatic ring-opening family dioxygenase n=1 Tax=unclassified Sodalis (in: enterobacteria) TaxID=2636512 RepID=UPI0039B3D929